MKLKCLLGRHDAAEDLSDWRNGYYLSVCACCGVKMRNYGSGWSASSSSRNGKTRN